MHAEATSVRVGSCPFCPAVHVFLLDATGKIFSSCAIPIETVETFCNQIRDAADENRSRMPAPRMTQ
jgi:hypothetical protein